MADLLTPSQCDPRELALADLDHVTARLELQRAVADDRAVDPHTATIDQAQRLAGGRREVRLLEERADADRRPRQRHLGNLIGHAALGAIIEVSLRRVRRRRTMKARGDL